MCVLSRPRDTGALLESPGAGLWDPVLGFGARDARREFRTTRACVRTQTEARRIAAARRAIDSARPRGVSGRCTAHESQAHRLGGDRALHWRRTRLYDRKKPEGDAMVGEDWNMDPWGRDAVALDRSAIQLQRDAAAATVLRLAHRD